MLCTATDVGIYGLLASQSCYHSMLAPCWFTLWTSGRFIYPYILLISLEIFLFSCMVCSVLVYCGYHELHHRLYCSSCKICAVLCCCRYGTDTSPTVLSSVDCSTSDYLVILQCSYDSTPPSSCTNSDDVSVYCCESLKHNSVT